MTDVLGSHPDEEMRGPAALMHSSDGHFVMVTEPPKLNVVLDWFEELRQKVPTH